MVSPLESWPLGYVERQPFRSMGFVSVLITSPLFALGLPVVLL